MESAPQRLIPSRIKPDKKLFYEKKFLKKGFEVIIGVDEAGRGPLAGPVVSAAVHLKKTEFEHKIDDSKKLNLRERESAFSEIINSCAFGLGIAGEKIIDRINIREATRFSMEEAVKNLIRRMPEASVKNTYVIVDGNMPLNLPFLNQAIVKGDSKSLSIAAASILAKVIRDRMMLNYDKAYPAYGFARHKGYPTREHRDLLKSIGPCPIHRKTFAGV